MKRLCAERDARRQGPHTSATGATGGGGRQKAPWKPIAGRSGDGVAPHPFPSLQDAASTPGAPRGSGGEAAERDAQTVGEAVSGADTAASDGTATAGFTLDQADERHQPPSSHGSSFDDCDVTRWSAYLAKACLPQAPEHFMRASGAAALDVPFDLGGALEAEMMVEQIAVMWGE